MQTDNKKYKKVFSYIWDLLPVSHFGSLVGLGRGQQTAMNWNLTRHTCAQDRDLKKHLKFSCCIEARFVIDSISIDTDMLLIRVCVSQTNQLGPYTASETICGVKKRRMGLQKKDTEQQFPPKIKDGDVILNADIKFLRKMRNRSNNVFSLVLEGRGDNWQWVHHCENTVERKEKRQRGKEISSWFARLYNNTESRFAFQKETSVLAEVHLNEETLPNGEVAKNGGAICGLLYDALLEALVKGKDGTFTIWEVSFAWAQTEGRTVDRIIEIFLLRVLLSPL